MSSRKFDMHDGKIGSALSVRLTPKASRNALAGIAEDGTIKVHVSAPPKDGKDNEAMIKLLAEVLSVPESNIAIVAGDTGRDKLVSVIGLDAVTLTRLVRAHLG